MIIETNRILIESTVRRTLRQIQESPERAVRNLVDLGLEFSSGRFQKQFLKAAQEMLYSQESAYYLLVEDIVNSVDHEVLTAFGVNLGDNGCTKGARLIREIEAGRGFNIPWSLTLAVGDEKLGADPSFYPNLLRQGVSLGIYTYLLFPAGDPDKVLPLLQGRPECAFILFLHGYQVSDPFIQKIKAVKNVMFSICDGQNMPAACQKLRAAKRLYSVYLCYNQRDRGRILGGEWVESVLPEHPAFAILRTDEYSMPEMQKEIYRCVVSARSSQRYPLILGDLKQDVLAIDRIVSDDECLVGFDADGHLRTYKGMECEERYSIFSRTLEDVLQTVQAAR